MVSDSMMSHRHSLSYFVTVTGQPTLSQAHTSLNCHSPGATSNPLPLPLPCTVVCEESTDLSARPQVDNVSRWEAARHHMEPGSGLRGGLVHIIVATRQAEVGVLVVGAQGVVGSGKDGEGLPALEPGQDDIAHVWTHAATTPRTQ